MNQVSPGRRGPLFCALSLATLVSTLAASATFAGSTGATSPIYPDLAGSVANTSLIGEGDMQVETSVARTQDGDGTAFSRVWSTPTLLRFGMPNYELRVSTPAYARVRTFSGLATGMADVTLGLKGIVPQSWDKDLSLALLVQASLPSGSQLVRNKGVRPEMQVLGAWALPSENVIRATAGVRADVDAADLRYPTGVLGLNFTHTWNPAFFTYGELAARQIRSAKNGGKNTMFGFGAGWRPMAATQLDATAAWGVKDNDTDMAFTLGISRRFHPPAPGQWGHKQDTQPETPPSASTEDGK